MSSTTTQRRKIGSVKSGDSLTVQVELEENRESTSVPMVTATVRRRFCGTGPFDRYWLNLDCCGLFCALITYCLHAYGVYAVCFVLIPPWMSTTSEDGIRSLSIAGIGNRIGFSLLAALAVAAHFKTMTTDPGTVPPDAQPLPETEEKIETEEEKQLQNLMIVPTQKGRRLCRRCKAFKPQRAHHCSVCRRCVIKMDHHCPWVNNCVGIGNHKYFLLFVFYTFLTCTYSMVFVITRFATCVSHDTTGGRHNRHHIACLDHPTQMLTVLGLLIEALLFGMFTSCMMYDQSEVIRSKLTHIDRLKGLDIGGSLEGITEVFGIGSCSRDVNHTGFRCDWLSPFRRVCYPPSAVDEVMGFCRLARKGTSETELPARSNGSALRKVADLV